MSYDPTKTPESPVDSGDTTPVSDGAPGSAPEQEVAPEVGHDAQPAPEAGPAPDAEPSDRAGDAARTADADRAAAGEAGPAEDGETHHLNLAALSAKADEYLGLAQRTKADFENYRKRAVREAAAAQERGAIKLAKALLPAIDNLDRALAHGVSAADADNGTASFVAGIEHVRTDVIEALGHVGIESYSPEGQPFDPQYHEAVAQQPADGVQPGTVIEVYQRGYRLGDHVLRPARVVVAA
jgi:molecular chaperone GrpE